MAFSLPLLLSQTHTHTSTRTRTCTHIHSIYEIKERDVVFCLFIFCDLYCKAQEYAKKFVCKTLNVSHGLLPESQQLSLPVPNKVDFNGTQWMTKYTTLNIKMNKRWDCGRGRTKRALRHGESMVEKILSREQVKWKIFLPLRTRRMIS